MSYNKHTVGQQWPNLCEVEVIQSCCLCNRLSVRFATFVWFVFSVLVVFF